MKKGATVIEVFIVIILLGVVVVIGATNISDSMRSAHSSANIHKCLVNQGDIAQAKVQWQAANHKKIGDLPTWDDLRPYLRGTEIPRCPNSGTYSINSIGVAPSCEIEFHNLRRL